MHKKAKSIPFSFPMDFLFFDVTFLYLVSFSPLPPPFALSFSLALFLFERSLVTSTSHEEVSSRFAMESAMSLRCDTKCNRRICIFSQALLALTVNVSISWICMLECTNDRECTNERKRAFERYRMARIVIKPRGWFPIGTRGISRLRTSHTHIRTHTRGFVHARRARTCTCPCLDSPDSYIDPTDLISSSVIPWALTHLPTKEHLCEPIRNALATCSQVACPPRARARGMNSLSV